MKTKSANDAFATRLHALRQHAGLSVAELAERAGLGRTHVHQLESGYRRQPQLDTLRRLACALEVDLRRLVD